MITSQRREEEFDQLPVHDAFLDLFLEYEFPTLLLICGLLSSGLRFCLGWDGLILLEFGLKLRFGCQDRRNVLSASSDDALATD